MYNDNLTLDWSCEIKIEQSNDAYFKINTDKFFKNTISIEICKNESIDLLNLYLILKSYSNNILYVSSALLVMIQNTDQEFISNSIQIKEFRNISFYGFVDWFEKQWSNDWKYLENSETSSFFFVFCYKLAFFDFKLLPFIKPKYPWSSLLIKNFITLKDNEEYYRLTIKKQEIELKNVKQELNKIKKKLDLFEKDENFSGIRK